MRPKPIRSFDVFAARGKVCAISAICALSPRVGFLVVGLGIDSGPKGRVASSAGLGVAVNQSQVALRSLLVTKYVTAK
jgi:hypothetical protein